MSGKSLVGFLVSFWVDLWRKLVDGQQFLFCDEQNKATSVTPSQTKEHQASTADSAENNKNTEPQICVLEGRLAVS